MNPDPGLSGIHWLIGFYAASGTLILIIAISFGIDWWIHRNDGQEEKRIHPANGGSSRDGSGVHSGGQDREWR